MKTKKIQKPFDIEAWKNGAKIETRDGRKVRILCTDANITTGRYKRPIVGIVKAEPDEHTEEWMLNGHYMGHEMDPEDLVIVEEVEEPKWADDEEAFGEGWCIDEYSDPHSGMFYLNDRLNFRAFATEKQAKSALAMARISQLMAHDERYGGVITDEEWKNIAERKYTIIALADSGEIWRRSADGGKYFLAFHTAEQRELFLSENEQLVKDYLMI